MGKLAFALAIVIAAAVGVIAGSSDHARRKHAWREVTAAHERLSRSEELREEIDELRSRFVDVKHDLDAATTPAAATAARAKLFQLRVDMVAVEDEIGVLAGRRAAAHDL